jgi:hypothetical protein
MSKEGWGTWRKKSRLKACARILTVACLGGSGIELPRRSNRGFHLSTVVGAGLGSMFGGDLNK